MFKKKVRVSNSKKPEMFFEDEFRIDTGDPINKRLKPILAVIGGFLASSVTQDVTSLEVKNGKASRSRGDKLE